MLHLELCPFLHLILTVGQGQDAGQCGELRLWTKMELNVHHDSVQL